MKQNYRNYSIEITQDEFGSDFDPRGNDNLSTMVCFHRRYRLGDTRKHGLKSNDFDSWIDVKKYLEKENDIALIKPLYLYDHSGITISTTPFSCSWDSGQVGFIFVTKQDIRENWGIKKVTEKFLKWAEEIMEAEVKEYDNYITGNVFRYDIYDEEKNGIESCCGFICDSEENVWEDMQGEIKSIIDFHIKEKEEKLDNERFVQYCFEEFC